MTIEEMQRQRKRLGYTYAQIARMSGVPESTVQKVLAGITKSPGVDTVAAIEKALYTGSQDYTNGRMVAEVSYRNDLSDAPYVPEWAHDPKYPRQGYYTVLDYLNLPDDQRAELIDGVLYDMAAPSYVHQAIIVELVTFFRNMQKYHPGCHVCVSPLDVQLDCDNRTMVEPDILIICDPKKITKPRIVGAPDLVIEVLSPSTRRKDLQIKLGKYARAGVKEYWMIDPDAQTILVCIFGDENTTHMYTFDDKVPVWISGGEVSVDFSEIRRNITYTQDE